MLIRWFKTLHQKGILGINRRNADYILPYNPRALYPIVDDKLKTKALAEKNNIATPHVYAVIDAEAQIALLGDMLNPHSDFVIKPARGSGGEGIIVITETIKGRFRRSNGRIMQLGDLQHHISHTLSGIYSLGAFMDKAIIEYRVKSHSVFQRISYQGVPDIRIIVFKGFPVMAMLRLPTAESDGRANLHQGAVGAGIDIATGITLSGVLQNQFIDEHPDTLVTIAGHAIPYWDKVLQIAARCYELTGLGYIGVDIVIDENLGPLMLELNARPGLSIQIANRNGLVKRLEIIQATHPDSEPVPTAEKRIAFSQHFFSSK